METVAAETTKLLAEDRWRIAEDLRASVLQELFATTMRLASAENLADAGVAARIREAVEALDRTMETVRRTICELQSPDVAAD